MRLIASPKSRIAGFRPPLPGLAFRRHFALELLAGHLAADQPGEGEDRIVGAGGIATGRFRLRRMGRRSQRLSRAHQTAALEGSPQHGNARRRRHRLVLDPATERLRFLKTEAKSRIDLRAQTLQEARTGLDKDGGLPSSHALSFISASGRCRRRSIDLGVKGRDLQIKLGQRRDEDTQYVAGHLRWWSLDPRSEQSIGGIGRTLRNDFTKLCQVTTQRIYWLGPLSDQHLADAKHHCCP